MAAVLKLVENDRDSAILDARLISFRPRSRR